MHYKELAINAASQVLPPVILVRRGQGDAQKVTRKGHSREFCADDPWSPLQEVLSVFPSSPCSFILTYDMGFVAFRRNWPEDGHFTVKKSLAKLRSICLLNLWSGNQWPLCAQTFVTNADLGPHSGPSESGSGFYQDPRWCLCSLRCQKYSCHDKNTGLEGSWLGFHFFCTIISQLCGLD